MAGHSFRGSGSARPYVSQHVPAIASPFVGDFGKTLDEFVVVVVDPTEAAPRPESHLAGEDLHDCDLLACVIDALVLDRRGYPADDTGEYEEVDHDVGQPAGGELLADTALMDGLKGEKGKLDNILRNALKMAAERGTFIHLAVEMDGDSEDAYFMNTAADRQTVAKIESGELELAGLKPSGKTYVETEELPDIFTLYEQNIGMLTPMIADELRDAEKRYPEDWIRDAIKEAALNNKRSIKYIAKILETWSVEGRSDGAYQRDSKKTGPDRYLKGKYGHMVRR